MIGDLNSAHTMQNLSAATVNMSTVSPSDQTFSATALPSPPTVPKPFLPRLSLPTTILLLLVLFDLRDNHHILLWLLFFLIHHHLLLLVLLIVLLLLLLLFLISHHAPPTTTASLSESTDSGAELTCDAKIDEVRITVHMNKE